MHTHTHNPLSSHTKNVCVCQSERCHFTIKYTHAFQHTEIHTHTYTYAFFPFDTFTHHITSSRLFPSNPSRQLHILGHNRHSLRMNGAKIRVLEEAYKVSLRGLLERDHGLGLEAHIASGFLTNLPHQPL